jgi:hypothetical protein
MLMKRFDMKGIDLLQQDIRQCSTYMHRTHYLTKIIYQVDDKRMMNIMNEVKSGLNCYH